ncbi:MAG: MFS transporter [Chromatiaceae bacterium]|nr:MFS transporter [Chromatiaceae bacterium]
MPRPSSQLSLEFLLLSGISFFAFCNIAVFYGFYSYLGQIGIPVEWRGLLVGLEPFTAFVLRLLLIPLISVANATRVLLVGLLLLVITLLSYQWALSVPSLIPLRILHGATFVLLVSASITLVVQLIPEGRSAQGFSLFSLSTLLPYALMPPLAEWLLPHVTSAAQIYAGVSLLAIPAILLLMVGRRRLAAVVAGLDLSLTQRPSRQQLQEDFQRPEVVLLLLVNLCFYLCYSTVFYFMKDFAGQLDGVDVGLFFILSTATLILTRLTGSLVLDRFSKLPLLRISTLALALCLFALAQTDSGAGMSLLAGLYGLCLGVGLPLLNAVLFMASPPALRGVNANLSLFMMDAGFFLSPWVGGTFLAAGGAIGGLFTGAAMFLLLAFGLLLAVRPPLGEPQP